MSQFMIGDFIFLVVTLLLFAIVIVFVIRAIKRVGKREQQLRTLEERIEKLEKFNLRK